MLVLADEGSVGRLHARGPLEDLLQQRSFHRPHRGQRARPGQARSVRAAPLLGLILLAACGGPMRDGRRAMTRGDFEGAARRFRQAADADPEDPRAWLALGRAEMAAERYARARDAFGRVARLRRGAALPRVLIGHTWELQRRYDEALLAYRHATQAAPRSAYAHRVMGTRLLRWGQPELARAPLERAVRLAPDHAETWNALGLARYHTEDLTGAEAAFREGIALHPEHPGLRLGLAALLVNARRFEDALAVYREVLARRPRFAPAHVGRGLLLHELGREEEAERAFEAAVQVGRGRARYRRRLEAYRALRARD